ncbi:MAG: STAS domain-containing protein [Acidimicrobiia bacterium]
MATKDEIRVDIDGATAHVYVAGDVDMFSYDALQNALTDTLSQGFSRIQVDLGGVRFFGSEGVRCLTDAKYAAEQAAIDFRIVKASRPVAVVLKITNLDGLLAL